jgi:hypothetical protein
MSTVKDTCACGAKFEFTEQKGWGRGCDTMHKQWLTAHETCRNKYVQPAWIVPVDESLKPPFEITCNTKEK